MVVAIGALPVFGCLSPDQSYRLLTFFFDGVPPPGGVPDAGLIPGAELDARLETRKSQQPELSVHGPYAKKDCDLCHEASFSNILKAPKEELCWSCHELEDFPGKVVHGPVAAGDCTACHDPHRSLYPHLLVTEVESLCDGCHDLENFPGLDEHRAKEGEDCLSCHDPHASPRKYMLRAQVGAT